MAHTPSMTTYHSRILLKAVIHYFMSGAVQAADEQHLQPWHNPTAELHSTAG